MSVGKKKKVDKVVITIVVGLLTLIILPFILPNPALQQLNELEENVIEPHLNTILDDYEIVRINVDRYQDTEDTRTYEVIVNFDIEPITVGNETIDYETARYILVIKDGEEVISTTRR
ncbi:MAG: hypothetical protein LRY73_11735 [Bacillus sp. (in: Bacteria)]|nr:hypothetical protein [Bacillus sp. (in: firmicutes)]